MFWCGGNCNQGNIFVSVSYIPDCMNIVLCHSTPRQSVSQLCNCGPGDKETSAESGLDLINTEIRHVSMISLVFAPETNDILASWIHPGVWNYETNWSPNQTGAQPRVLKVQVATSSCVTSCTHIQHKLFLFFLSDLLITPHSLSSTHPVSSCSSKSTQLYIDTAGEGCSLWNYFRARGNLYPTLCEAAIKVRSLGKCWCVIWEW